MKKVLIALLFISLCATSCDFVGGRRIRGNGVIKSEARTAGTFQRIDASGNVKVYIKQDSAYSVRVETDENLLSYVIVENDNGSLKVHEKNNVRLRPTISVKVYVTGPSVREFEVSGASDLVSENTITSNEVIAIHGSGAADIKMTVNAPKVTADLSGAVGITLKGQTKDFKVDGSGSTNINCFELLAENTSIGLSGAGDADVFASVKLDVDVSGAADIRYKGEAVVNKSISGAGSVRKVQ
jgi:hypothetical protein